MFTIGSLILGTVLTGPAARPVAEVPSELADPFENAPAATARATPRSPRSDAGLVDPFSPTPKAVAPAKRIAVRESAPAGIEVRDPWAPVGEAEAAAKRIEPRAKANKDLHTPFPPATPRSMTQDRARAIEAKADLRNPFG